MIKYTFLYRLNLKGKTHILNHVTTEKNLKDAVGKWEEFKLTQTRVKDLIIFLRVLKVKILN